LTTEEAVQPRVATTNADEGVVEHAVSGAAGKAGLPAVDLTVASERGDTLRMLGVDQIRRGAYQPRRQFDQELLQELAASLKAQGMIQPILVRPFAGAYEIIAGERRWRAAQLAGIGEVPAIVRELDDQSVAAVSLIENIQRKDLNPLEEAQALQRLCEEFAMTHQAVADSVGRSRAAVTNLMRLLELHDEVKKLIDRGEVDMGHARALLGAPAADQLAIAQRIVKQGLTVRAVEKLVRELKNGKATTTAKSVSDPDIDVLTRRLGDMLGAPVRIRHKQSGAGKLEIAYTSVDELEGILAHIK
jgi:ParB family chromosome partitioning protein